MLLPPIVVNGVAYVSPDMSLFFTTAMHENNRNAAVAFALLYILGIPGLFFIILRRQRHNIFCVLIESDVGEYEALETGSDETTPQLYRRFGMTPMRMSLGADTVLEPSTKYTVTDFDDENGQAQLNNDPSLIIINAEDDAFTTASISFGWMCANYERKWCGCLEFGVQMKH